MLINHYDRVTKVFLCQTKAEPNPEGKGYLIPAFATDIPLPQNVPEGKALVFNGEGWDAFDDHRGKTAYCTKTKEPSEIDYVGTIKTGFTLKESVSEFEQWDDALQDWKVDVELERQAHNRSEYMWSKSELSSESKASVQITLHNEGSSRATFTKEAWTSYKEALRDYASYDALSDFYSVNDISKTYATDSKTKRPLSPAEEAEKLLQSTSSPKTEVAS
ncbi:hypothetical protein [Vibrio sonorensis]|uniref:hypothetical protein n=1 Tax=Vibrio sonorensis TaxID=1004316 RepID=UPI0008D94EDB|nr:hypothetical protein [Vibrio sonorensis]